MRRRRAAGAGCGPAFQAPRRSAPAHHRRAQGRRAQRSGNDRIGSAAAQAGGLPRRAAGREPAVRAGHAVGGRCRALRRAVSRHHACRAVQEGVRRCRGGGALADRARQYFDAAIERDPDDLASWFGLASLLADRRDADAARAFLPRAQYTLAQHPRSGELARAVAGLCAVSGDTDGALKYALMWEANALDSSSRARAAT